MVLETDPGRTVWSVLVGDDNNDKEERKRNEGKESACIPGNLVDVIVVMIIKIICLKLCGGVYFARVEVL